MITSLKHCCNARWSLPTPTHNESRHLTYRRLLRSCPSMRTESKKQSCKCEGLLIFLFIKYMEEYEYLNHVFLFRGGEGRLATWCAGVGGVCLDGINIFSICIHYLQMGKGAKSNSAHLYGNWIYNFLAQMWTYSQWQAEAISLCMYLYINVSVNAGCAHPPSTGLWW